MDTLLNILNIILAGVALKAIIIGSEFNFYNWFKYGEEYTHWYNNRPTFPKETPNHW
jgi:hypothetical protein